MTIAIFFVLIPSGLAKVGGFSGLQATLPESYFDPFAVGGMRIFSWFVLFTLGLMIGQDIWQRVFTAKSNKVAKQGTIIGGIYVIFSCLVLWSMMCRPASSVRMSSTVMPAWAIRTRVW